MNARIERAGNGRRSRLRHGRFAFSGALAGAVSAFVFTVIHDLFISNIWFALVPMLVAGVVCGALVSWSYALLADAPGLRGWLAYNLLYVGMFGLLGALSVLLFEPATTMAAVVSLNGPPDDLIRQALPLTAAFTLGMAVVVAVLYGRSWIRFAAALLTCVVLVALLGLNVSAIGLVAIPAGALYVIAELFGLIVVLNGVYTAVFAALERGSLSHPDRIRL